MNEELYLLFAGDLFCLLASTVGGVLELSKVEV